jgi:hypothetical protein
LLEDINMFLVPTLAPSASVNQANQSGVKLSCVLPQRLENLYKYST